MKYVLLVVWLLICGIDFSFASDQFSQTENEDTMDTSHWIDPNDPTSHMAPSHSSSKESATQQCILSDSAEPVLKLIIRSVFQQLQVDTRQRSGFYRTVSAQLGDYEVGVIEDFLNSQTSSASQRDAVRNVIKNLFHIVDSGLDSPSRFQLFVLAVEPWLVPLNILVAVLLLVWLCTKLFSRGAFYRTLLMLLFVVSLFTSYNRMYQEKMAARIAASMERNDACKAPGWSLI